MEVALFWIIFAAAAGFIASQRGRSGVRWFLLSIVISPLIAVIIVALIPSHPVAAASGSLEQQVRDKLLEQKTRASDKLFEQKFAPYIRKRKPALLRGSL